MSAVSRCATAVILVLFPAGCHRAAAGTGDDHRSGPTAASLDITVVYDEYGMTAKVPSGWVADRTRITIIPADDWRLHPDKKDHPSIEVFLSWLPRGGRQSAGFPGGLAGDEHAATRRIAGYIRAGTESVGGFKTDFDEGEVAVSISASATDDSRPTVDAILDGIALDKAKRPPGFPSPARRALDLARSWASNNSFPSDDIVLTGESRGSGGYSFTLFYAKGLVPLSINPSSGEVVRESL